jgi:hypothetical protein
MRVNLTVTATATQGFDILQAPDGFWGIWQDGICLDKGYLSDSDAIRALRDDGHNFIDFGEAEFEVTR